MRITKQKIICCSNDEGRNDLVFDYLMIDFVRFNPPDVFSNDAVRFALKWGKNLIFWGKNSSLHCRTKTLKIKNFFKKNLNNI